MVAQSTPSLLPLGAKKAVICGGKTNSSLSIQEMCHYWLNLRAIRAVHVYFKNIENTKKCASRMGYTPVFLCTLKMYRELFWDLRCDLLIDV